MSNVTNDRIETRPMLTKEGPGSSPQAWRDYYLSCNKWKELKERNLERMRKGSYDLRWMKRDDFNSFAKTSAHGLTYQDVHRKPAYRDIEAGLDGRIWVQLNTAAEPIPEAELPPLAPDQSPSSRRTTRTRAVYDVYTPGGALLGRVMLPWKTSLSTSAGDLVWGTATDSLDVPYAVRFRIDPPLPRGP